MKLSSLNILLVEDDEVDIMNIKRSFEKNGLKNPLFVARNGLEALWMMRGENEHERISPMPRIILLDLNMPKMNGFEFLREIRNDPKFRGISAFVVASAKNESEMKAVFDLGVAGYIVKPTVLEDWMLVSQQLIDFWQLCEYV